MNCSVEAFQDGIGGGFWARVNGFTMEQTSTPATARAYWGESGRSLRVLCSGQFSSNILTW